MSRARCGGTEAVVPAAAPEAASVNSRTRLSTCSLAAISRSVGTSPSSTVTVGLPGAPASETWIVAGSQPASAAGAWPPASPVSSAQTTLPGSAGRHPHACASASTRRRPRPVMAPRLGSGRTGGMLLPSATSMRSPSVVDATRSSTGGFAWRIALVTSSLATRPASSMTP